MKPKPKTKRVPKPGTPHRSTLYRRRKAEEAAARAAASTPSTSTAADELRAVGLPGAAPGGPVHQEVPAEAFELAADPTPPAAAGETRAGGPTTDATSSSSATVPLDAMSPATTATEDGTVEPARKDDGPASPSPTSPDPSQSSESTEAPGDTTSTTSTTPLGTSFAQPRSGVCHKHRHAPTKCTVTGEDGKACDEFVYPPLDEDEARRSAEALIPTLARAYLRGAEPPPLDEQETRAWGHVFQETREMYGWPNPGQAALLTAAGLAFSYAGRCRDIKDGTNRKAQEAEAERRRAAQAKEDREQDAYERVKREDAAKQAAKPATRDDDEGDDEDGDELPEHEGALRRSVAA